MLILKETKTEETQVSGSLGVSTPPNVTGVLSIPDNKDLMEGSYSASAIIFKKVEELLRKQFSKFETIDFDIGSIHKVKLSQNMSHYMKYVTLKVPNRLEGQGALSKGVKAAVLVALKDYLNNGLWVEVSKRPSTKDSDSSDYSLGMFLPVQDGM